MDGTPREVFSHGDELRQLGLALPDAAEIAEELRRAGLPLTGSFMTMEETADAVAKALKK